MTPVNRPVCFHHCTPEPFQFFGRTQELQLLDEALHDGDASVIAMIGPGGQGKTAIVQTWLQRLMQSKEKIDGIFLWSFYRGKNSDLCLRELYRYAEGLPSVPDLSAGYCVDHLLPTLRNQRWAIVLDGTEVVQHETGSWYGRFLHPELGRLLEELAGEPMPGVAVVTTRFPLPTLERRNRAKLISLASLDSDSALSLLRSLGLQGSDTELRKAAQYCGYHAKAVELLGTYFVHFHKECYQLPEAADEEPDDEESRVARVLMLFRRALSQEVQDILALATAFRHPPEEQRLLQYLSSQPLRQMLHETWKRTYTPFAERDKFWLSDRIGLLVQLRLLERVHSGLEEGRGLVIDAHPLVRRGFEGVLGVDGHQHQARARAGFLRGRPDRQRPQSLEEAREEVELFHAYSDAGMWNDADSVLVSLDNPKHRFLAPAFERDLLLRFFPNSDFREKPLWSGFGRYRSLAICFEMLGQFQDALETYRPSDSALGGDALIALGRLQLLLDTPHMAHPWQTLWKAYRAHALCLAGRTKEAVSLALSLVPVDVYEWAHVFECLLRAGQLQSLDMNSVLYRPPHSEEHRWSRLTRQRMRLDYQRIMEPEKQETLDREYRQLLEEYDRGGLPWERSLTRLSFGRWLLAMDQPEDADSVFREAQTLAERFSIKILKEEAESALARIKKANLRP